MRLDESLGLYLFERRKLALEAVWLVIVCVLGTWADICVAVAGRLPNKCEGGKLEGACSLPQVFLGRFFVPHLRRHGGRCVASEAVGSYCAVEGRLERPHSALCLS